MAFRLAAVVFWFATAYHLVALSVPVFARMACPANYPASRHVAFVTVDTSFGLLFLLRPHWLIWPYLVLTIQVIKGHGGAAWTLWHDEGHFDYVSIASVTGVILGLGLLAQDLRRRLPRSVRQP